MGRVALAVLLLIGIGGCSERETGTAPRRGVIAAPTGGADGYQHGPDGSRFALGGRTARKSEHGYLKLIGDQGTLAIDNNNGSVFGRPRTDAASLSVAPYGSSPDDHNRFVHDYFASLGLPRAQIAALRGMTMLEASGRSDEDTSRAQRRVTGYYTVLDRAIDGIPVPDSFAWARVDVQGRVVEEAVYWPAIPAEAVADAGRIREALRDPQRRVEFAGRVPTGASGSAAIRHTSATTDRMFVAFGTLDVLERLAPSEPSDVPPEAQTTPRNAVVVVRHFDVRGEALLLPQEGLGMDRAAVARSIDRR